MKNLIIDLNPRGDNAEDYAENDRNVVQVRVQLPTGEMVSTPNYRVEISLSRDAMIGLATHLLRAAHRPEGQFFFQHLRPCDSNLASQILGVFMHPKSCELLVAEVDLGTLEDALCANESGPTQPAR